MPKKVQNPQPTLKKNQKKPEAAKTGRGGARPNSGRKKGSIASVTKKALMDELNKLAKQDPSFSVETMARLLHDWLYSPDSRLQTFAFEQIFGKATQPLVTEDEDGNRQSLSKVIVE